jgi:hypothetical protein
MESGCIFYNFFNPTKRLGVKATFVNFMHVLSSLFIVRIYIFHKYHRITISGRGTEGEIPFTSIAGQRIVKALAVR